MRLENYNLSGRIKTLIMFEQMQLVLVHSTRTSAVLTFAYGSVTNRDLIRPSQYALWASTSETAGIGASSFTDILKGAERASRLPIAFASSIVTERCTSCWRSCSASSAVGTTQASMGCVIGSRSKP